MASSEKRERVIPKRFLPVGGGEDFDRLGRLCVDKNVGFARQRTGAPAYSDADLRLMVSQLEVAKEEFEARADLAIATLQAILAGEGQAAWGEGRPTSAVDPSYVGYATVDGALFLYRDENQLRDVIASRKFGQAGWVVRVADPATKEKPDGHA